MAAKGTEALDGAPKAKTEPKAKPKAAKSAKRKIHHIISRLHTDGTVGHTHVFAGKDGHPDLTAAPEEYSSPSADDAGAHVAQALGGGDPADGAGPDAGPTTPAQDPGAAPAAAAGE